MNNLIHKVSIILACYKSQNFLDQPI